MKGRIITLTGLDGCGKATQTKILVERLLRLGHKVKTLSFPRYDTFWGKVIKAYLAGQFGTLSEIDPKDASMLFAMDRLKAKPLILDWINKGYNVVLDRYIESNYAHQGSKFDGDGRIKMIDWIHDLETKQFKIPEADVVLFLDLPVEFTMKAITQRNVSTNNNTKDLHESNIHHLKATEETYKYLAQRFKNWITIPCLKSKNKRYSVEEQAELIWNKVKQYFIK